MKHAACVTTPRSEQRSSRRTRSGSSATATRSTSKPARNSRAAIGEPLLEQAAQLIVQHIPDEEVGPVWEACHHFAAKHRLTRGFLRIQERRIRIDRWRKECGRKGQREPLTSLNWCPDDGPETIETLVDETHRPIIGLPDNFVQRVFSQLADFERTIAHSIFIEELPQKALCAILGLTEGRISQLVGLVRAKLYRALESLFPGIVEELA